MEEVIKIGRESGVRIHYSHFKVCGKKNWDKVDKVIELLKRLRRRASVFPSTSTHMWLEARCWV